MTTWIRHILVATASLITLGYGRVIAQELDANVYVDYELISAEQREDVMSMANDIEIYLDNQTFLYSDWEGAKIPVDVSITLTGRSGNTYSAQMYLQSYRYTESGGKTRTIRIMDVNWSFEYYRNAVLSYQPRRFNAFTSVIDFYMLVLIGLDLDSYDALSGQEAYEQALTIFNTAQAAGDIPGFERSLRSAEYSRHQLITELLGIRYEPFRTYVFNYYYDGIDLLSSDREAALDGAAKALEQMVFYKNKQASTGVFMQLWFDSKYAELADLFKDYYDKETVKKMLMYLDPGHTIDYNEVLGG